MTTPNFVVVVHLIYVLISKVSLLLFHSVVDDGSLGICNQHCFQWDEECGIQQRNIFPQSMRVNLKREKTMFGLENPSFKEEIVKFPCKNLSFLFLVLLAEKKYEIKCSPISTCSSVKEPHLSFCDKYLPHSTHQSNKKRFHFKRHTLLTSLNTQRWQHLTYVERGFGQNKY